MSFTEASIIALISSIASLIGGSLVVIVAWRKAKPEMEKTEAEASKTWAETNQMAAEQNINLMTQLQTERTKRMELESQVSEIKLQLAVLTSRVKRLEAQIVSLGAEPVK